MVIAINAGWIQDNKQEPLGAAENTLKYLKTASGATKALQVIQKPLRLFNQVQKEMGQAPTPSVLKLERDLSTGVAVLNIPRIPAVTADAAKAISEIDDLDGMSVARKAARTVGSLFDAFTTYCYCLLFVRPIPIIGGLAQAVDLTSDLVSVPVDYSDWRESSRLEAQAQGEAKAAISHSRKYYLLTLAKDIVSISSAIFGLALLPVMPVTGLILLSLAGTIIGISKDLLKSGGAYPIISFDRGVQLA